jgi:hypothetical protein
VLHKKVVFSSAYSVNIHPFPTYSSFNRGVDRAAAVYLFLICALPDLRAVVMTCRSPRSMALASVLFSDETVRRSAAILTSRTSEVLVSMSGLSVSLHLRKRGVSYQKPCYRDVARDEQEVERIVF